MRIGIDIRHLSAKRHSGVEEYTCNLLPTLFYLGKKDQFILLYNGFRKKLPPEISVWKNFPNVEIKEFSWPNKIFNGSLWSANRPRLDVLLGGIDIMFFPNITFQSVSPSIPFVTTFHDLSFEILPHSFNPYRRFWHFLINPRLMAERSSAIITVSRSTAEDIRKIYQVSPEKIYPIYLGLDEIFLQSQKGIIKPLSKEDDLQRFYGLPEKPFILYLGTLEPRKNILGVIRAFEIFKNKTKAPHKLVIAGATGWSYKEIFLWATRSRYKKDIFFPGAIRDYDRPCLYKMADIFVFPSFLEGFGLPPLEAIALGTPVICSSSSSLLEILGSHALMINPYNIGELAWAIERGISDSNLRKSLVAEGIAYAQNFTWEKTAAATLEVLHNVARKSVKRESTK